MTSNGETFGSVRFRMSRSLAAGSLLTLVSPASCSRMSTGPTASQKRIRITMKKR